MPYTVDRTAQLEDALARNRFGAVASLRSAGTPSRQHNTDVTKGKAKKSASAKKTVSAKPAKKSAVKKSAAKTSSAKKVSAKPAKKATPTKKS